MDSPWDSHYSNNLKLNKCLMSAQSVLSSGKAEYEFSTSGSVIGKNTLKFETKKLEIEGH